MTPLEFIEKIRYDIQNINNKILRHDFIKETLEKKISINGIKIFVEQQYYITLHDAKSLAIMYSRTNFPDNEFFLKLLIDHQHALKRIDKFLSYFKINKNKIEPIADIVSYTHFLLKIAYFHNLYEQIICIMINFPIFIENINKIGKALIEKYSIKEASFFKEAKWDKEIEFLGLKILEKFDLKREREKILKSVKLIQNYELLFWDSIYKKAKEIK